MEWHQLEYFKALAEIEHFTRAAQKLAISQPALSRSIAKLERELGFPLFERYGKRIVLNQYGTIFLRHVERALEEIVAGRQIILDLLSPEHGSVSLAFIHSLGASMVPKLLGSFREQYPQIQFKLYENGTSVLLDQLAMGEIDLCLCSSMLNKENLAWASLYTEELFVAVPSTHRLAKRSCIALREIAAEPIISFKHDSGLRALNNQLFAQSGIEPVITFEGDEIMTVAGLVEAQLGVALIPKIARLDQTKLVMLPVSNPPCARTIGLAWNKNRYLSPVAKTFQSFVIRSFAQ